MEKFNFILSLGLAIVFHTIFKGILEDNIFTLTGKSYRLSFKKLSTGLGCFYIIDMNKNITGQQAGCSMITFRSTSAISNRLQA